MKWSDIVQCDPTGSICPIAGSGCSKFGAGPNGQPCPSADLVANCQPNALAPNDPKNCAYNWALFDYWTVTYNAHGVSWMYSAYSTPDYLSVRGSRCVSPGQAGFGADATCLAPADSCGLTNAPTGGCDPPSDIDLIPGSGFADGTDQNYIWFVSALSQHAFNSFEQVKYWEVWDGPDSCAQWNHSDQIGVDCTKLNPGGGPSFGTSLQLVRMATDAKATLPAYLSGVKIVSGAMQNIVENSAYMIQILTDNTSAFDYTGYEGYFANGAGCPNNCPVPELESVDWQAYVDALGLADLGTKKAIDTAFSWGPTTNVTDPDMRMAFVTRSYLLQESYFPQLSSANWVGEDYVIDLTPNPNNGGQPNGGNGQLWASGANYLQDMCMVPDGTQGGYDCPAGVALKQIQKWTIGNGFNSACTCSASPNGGSCSATPPAGIWECPISGSNAYQGLVVWDSTVTTFPCSNAPCGTTVFNVPSQYTADWQDLTGTINPLMGAKTVMIGAKPILLENE